MGRKYPLIILCMALSAFFVYFPLTDTDIFWHLASGREMVRRGAFLYSDPFSFTLQSPRWIDLHWLFQLLAYGLYRLGREPALLGFKLAVVACVAGLLCLMHPSKRYAAITSLLAALLFYEVRYLAEVRPVLVTMVCMALLMFIFERVRETGKTRLVWLCIPLQILWANSQGLYMLGLFIIGAYWFEGVVGRIKDRKEKPVLLTVVFALCILSSFVSPYGMAGVLLPFRLLDRIRPSASNIYSLNIAENVPLFSLTGFDAHYRTMVMATALAAAALFVVNRKKARPAHVVLFAGFLVLAICAMRNVLLYTIAIIPVLGHNAALCVARGRFAGLSAKKKRFAGALCASVACLWLGFDLMRHAALAAAFPPHRQLSPFCFPEKIAARLKHDPVPGEMFNDLRYGGYLLWELYPQKKVFIDTRLVIRSPGFFAEYLAICDRPELFEGVADRFAVTQVILPAGIFPLYGKLIRTLYASRQWGLEYTDGSSVLFVRRDFLRSGPVDLSDKKTVCSVMDSLRAQWAGSPGVYREALGYFGELLDTLGMGGSSAMVNDEKARAARGGGRNVF